MTRRPNYLDADENAFEQNLRFVNNDVEDNINQYFGGMDGKPSTSTNISAPPRDYKLVTPMPGDPDYQREFDDRKQFLLQVGLSRHEAYEFTKRTFDCPDFNLKHLMEKRHKMRLKNVKQAVADERILTIIKHICRKKDIPSISAEHRQPPVAPMKILPPEPPRNLSWNADEQIMLENRSRSPQPSYVRDRRVDNYNLEERRRAGCSERVDKPLSRIPQREIDQRKRHYDDISNIQRYSPSPKRRLSRSPHRRLSRSPRPGLSGSPRHRVSRSSNHSLSSSIHRRLSRSPHRRRSRSPIRRFSPSPIRRFHPDGKIAITFGNRNLSPPPNIGGQFFNDPIESRYSRSPQRRFAEQMRNITRSPIPNQYVNEGGRPYDDEAEMGRFLDGRPEPLQFRNGNCLYDERRTLQNMRRSHSYSPQRRFEDKRNFDGAMSLQKSPQRDRFFEEPMPHQQFPQRDRFFEEPLPHQQFPQRDRSFAGPMPQQQFPQRDRSFEGPIPNQQFPQRDRSFDAIEQPKHDYIDAPQVLNKNTGRYFDLNNGPRNFEEKRVSGHLQTNPRDFRQQLINIQEDITNPNRARVQDGFDQNNYDVRNNRSTQWLSQNRQMDFERKGNLADDNSRNLLGQGPARLMDVRVNLGDNNYCEPLRRPNNVDIDDDVPIKNRLRVPNKIIPNKPALSRTQMRKISNVRANFWSKWWKDNGWIEAKLRKVDKNDSVIQKIFVFNYKGDKSELNNVVGTRFASGYKVLNTCRIAYGSKRHVVSPYTFLKQYYALSDPSFRKFLAPKHEQKLSNIEKMIDDDKMIDFLSALIKKFSEIYKQVNEGKAAEDTKRFFDNLVFHYMVQRAFNDMRMIQARDEARFAV